MKARDTTRSIGQLMTHADQIIDEIHDSRQPVIITHNGQPCAVVQDFESYERQRDALIMLQLLATWRHEPKREQATARKRGPVKSESKTHKLRKTG